MPSLLPPSSRQLWPALYPQPGRWGGNLGAVCHPHLVAPAPDCKGSPWPRAAEPPTARHPNLTTSSRGVGCVAPGVPTPTPHGARDLTEYHGRRAVGRGSFWGGGGWKEDVEEPELGRGLQEQRQRQQRNPAAAAPHGKLGRDPPDVFQAKQPFIFFTQVQPRGTRAAGEGRAARGWP